MTTFSDLVDHEGSFVTVYLPSPSRLDDAEHQFEVRWKNARRALGDAGVGDRELGRLDEIVAGNPHHAGAALAVVAAVDGGPTLTEFLAAPIGREVAVVDTLPRLGPILEDRQRTIPHVVVHTDRTGAEVISFDGGQVIAADLVEGELEHIHRGAPGGWSQRRYQQRAENVWDSNAGEVADVAVQKARAVGAKVLAVAGDVRAVGFFVDDLPHDIREITTVIDGGSDDAIAEGTMRLVDDHVARRSAELLASLRDRRKEGGSCVGHDDTLAALGAGRVEQLLVHDDPDDERRATLTVDGASLDGRLVDVAIAGALKTGAKIRIVPNAADLTDGLGALLRW